MAVNRNFGPILAATDRADLFIEGARQLGTSAVNIEKDFWVCHALDVLFNGLSEGGPRLLFKGGTSLSKAFGLISRFSEDIDVTVFRGDIGMGASIEEIERFGANERRRYLDKIKADCSTFIKGSFAEAFTDALRAAFREAGADPSAFSVEPDDGDPDGQTLLFWYPESDIGDAGGYIRKAVKIESGAKSALDPHVDAVVKPYIADVLPDMDLSVKGVTTIEPIRTFWDKIIIAHGQRRWFDNKGAIKGGGLRVSRHYYDIYKLIGAGIGEEALGKPELGLAVQRHAMMFFNQNGLDLASATPGSFSIVPAGEMLDVLRGDYGQMKGMIFGEAPAFDEIVDTLIAFETRLNASGAPTPTR